MNIFQLAGMSKGTFFTNYRYNPGYAALLDVKTDRMHRVWLAREACTRGGRLDSR